MIFIINNAVHVSGVHRPSSGASKLYVQLYGNNKTTHQYMTAKLSFVQTPRPKHFDAGR
jgi:hypothetical protein